MGVSEGERIVFAAGIFPLNSATLVKVVTVMDEFIPGCGKFKSVEFDEGRKETGILFFSSAVELSSLLLTAPAILKTLTLLKY